jgi:chromosome partitioning protein
MNMKGGVGKSTVTMHVAGMLGRYQINKKYRKILMIDYDPQFNLSQAFLPASSYFAIENARKTTLSILVDDQDDLNPYELQVPGNESAPEPADLTHRLYANKGGGELHIIPSTLNLMYIALGQTEKRTKPMEARFSEFIAKCRDEYDAIFIDCHPAGSIFTKTSLQNSDHVLVPVVPHKFAARGIGLMQQFVAAKKAGSGGPKTRILFNNTPRFGVSAIEANIRADPKFGPLCLATSLKSYKAFSEPEGGKGFVWVSGKPYSWEAFNNLTAVATEIATTLGV